MIEASCHCGAVRIAYPHRPRRVTACNCSICRRYAPLWTYTTREQVTFSAKETQVNLWGERQLEFHRCRTCGCVTHWESVDPAPAARMAVNARLFAPEVLEGVPIRRFDGAKTWRYLDES